MEARIALYVAERLGQEEQTDPPRPPELKLRPAHAASGPSLSIVRSIHG